MKQKNFQIIIIMAVIIVCIVGFASCNSTKKITTKENLTILAGSENQALEPLIQEFAKKNNYKIDFVYKGSVDIMMDLQSNKIKADAVWPADSLWISMGDKSGSVKLSKSIMTSPVVFGIEKNLAKSLGFVDKKEVSIKDILNAIKQKKLNFMMTSASQSNSGASAYLGFIHALLNSPEAIQENDLQNPMLKKDIKDLLGGINRTSGSSGWLKDLFLKGGYNSMVNYESVIIETNNELIKQGKEPLYIIYPYDGLTVSDSPLGYINKGNSNKETTFKELQKYLLSEDVQQKISKLGRRTGFGNKIKNPDKTVFNPDWGIDPDKILSPIRFPSTNVIKQALNYYQTDFKKPSATVFCLDYSGSMDGEGYKKLKESMRLILDQNVSKEYFLQTSSEDVIVVMPFSGKVLDTWSVKGNNPADLNKLLKKIENFPVNGATDIYSPTKKALEYLKEKTSEKYIKSIVLMTDGESNTGSNFTELQASWVQTKEDIPVFSITFGSASEKQLKPIAELTKAKIFDGKKDLVSAFKSVRGYN